MMQKINNLLEKIVLEYLEKRRKEEADEKYFEDILESMK